MVKGGEESSEGKDDVGTEGEEEACRVENKLLQSAHARQNYNHFHSVVTMERKQV